MYSLPKPFKFIKNPFGRIACSSLCNAIGHFIDVIFIENIKICSATLYVIIQLIDVDISFDDIIYFICGEWEFHNKSLNGSPGWDRTNVNRFKVCGLAIRRRGNGCPGRSRTHHILTQNQAFYQLNYRASKLRSVFRHLQCLI